ncbi:class C sortase [Bifidobacterium felsineum]|uniref:class C sortase n=1 Tax=Bifidobacterium felsineum TaxID=2045440 RepID=UPI001BDC728C|nr:class C sortase [Bifidobacterium felsineum]MBT1163194.1 class C sortase [Bifidobacterium felsineum]
MILRRSHAVKKPSRNVSANTDTDESSEAPTSSTATFTPVPFAAAIDISDLTAERRRLKRNLIAMRLLTIVLLIAAISVACFPLALQFQSGLELAKTAATSAQNVANWPYPQADDALKAARAYNKKLAESGQPVLGEAVDPFSGAQGGSQASGEDSASAKDKEYQSLLNTGGEVMGTIKVPKQSIDLPIYHGTSEEALASGAGHLYGTSLPVGGSSTHSVITGHRGLVEAMMFTRLDEVKEGDFFYIEVMGETLGYKVDRISVILPNDTSQLKIVPGEDRVTLMTCTPYGVNTHRLLISGHRVAIPVPAPEPNDVHDARNIAIAVGVGLLALGWFFVWLVRRHQVTFVMRHGAWWPYQKRRGMHANNTLGPLM